MSILDTFRLDGQVAIITGGGSGIGAGIARGFAEAGADVAIVGRSETPLERVRQDVEARSRRCTVIADDVTVREAPARIVEKTVKTLGRLDILVNNVGGMGNTKTIYGPMEIPDEIWDQQLNVNLSSVLHMTQAAVPQMHDGGAIVNMSSIMAYKPIGGAAGYISCKAALNNLTVMLAHDLAPKKIRVNGIAPGPIATGALTGPLGLKTQEDYDRTAKEWGVWVGRLGTPEDIAAVALLMASRAGGFITGQTYIVAGGM